MRDPFPCGMKQGLEADADRAHQAVGVGVLTQIVIVLHADVEAVVGVAHARAGVEGVPALFAFVSREVDRAAVQGHAVAGHGGAAGVVHEVVGVAEVRFQAEAAAIREIDGIPRRDFQREQQRTARRPAHEAVTVGPGRGVVQDGRERVRVAVDVLEADGRGENEAVNRLEVVADLAADIPVVGVVVGLPRGGAIGRAEIVVLVHVPAEERSEDAVQGRVRRVAVDGVVVDLRAVAVRALVLVVATAVGERAAEGEVAADEAIVADDEAVRVVVVAGCAVPVVRLFPLPEVAWRSRCSGAGTGWRIRRRRRSRRPSGREAGHSGRRWRR